MIEISHLKNPEDIGRWVVYNRDTWKKHPKGRIKRWSDDWVYVVYSCSGRWDQFMDYAAMATDPKDLDFVVT
jgi:hypothetical protein